MVRSVGLERLAWLSILVAAICQVVRPFSGNTWTFLLLSSLAYACMGVGNVLLPPLVKRHFPDRMAPVSGLYVLLISVGTVLPALTAVPVADLVGWRMSAGAWGVVAFAAVWPWLVVDHRVTREPPAEDEGDPAPYLPVAQLVRSPLAWGLVGVFGINSLNAYAMFAWLPTILSESGIGAYSSGLYLSLFATAALPCAFVVPWLAERVRSPLPMIVGFAACYATGYVGLLLAPTTGTALWVCLTGLGPGAFPLTLALVNLRSATVAGAAALSGFVHGLGYAVAGIGPFAAGLLRELDGTWRSAIAFLLASLLLQVLAGVLVSRPGTLESQLPKMPARC